MGMADRIKERRQAMKYTQEELAEKLGLQKSAIAKYENGRVENLKQNVIVRMAEILECDPAYLMGWSDSMKSEESRRISSDSPAASRTEAIFIAVKNMLIANGDRERADSLTEEEAIRLYETSGLGEVTASKQPHTIAAHFDGTEFTQTELDKIREFAAFVKASRK